jgi:hypothetical protein
MLKNNGVLVDRFNLTNAPQEFVTNKTVNNFINEKGVEDLPVVVVDGEIILTGRYPSNDEFVKLLDIPESYIGGNTSDRKAEIKKNQGCGCSGGDCCC